jgi:ABC-2 type transport system ATP-binding protein
MLVGVLVPTSGSITIGGIIPHKNRIKYTHKIGVVFGQRSQLWWDTPVIESLNLLKYMYEIPEKQFRDNMALFSEILDLKDLQLCSRVFHLSDEGFGGNGPSGYV